ARHSQSSQRSRDKRYLAPEQVQRSRQGLRKQVAEQGQIARWPVTVACHREGSEGSPSTARIKILRCAQNDGALAAPCHITAPRHITALRRIAIFSALED